jgi:hypothetical protein
MCSRITWSIISTMAIDLIIYLAVFVSYIWLSIYSYNSNGVNHSGQLSIPIYIMVCMSLGGWVLLSVFGGVGLAALPIDLIQSFTNRPRILKVE